ncbi:zinc finger ZZ-type and EF-hand domain-containing protein 1 isoform X2 [Notamacropus eugenii]|uniref:zinc finger ZZ-type and EF-hand domain-containing protein 1 isoform X2 n=1 Tax=Notamacropus eugenii TaxID=9315 RepID=UPI003B67E900
MGKGHRAPTPHPAARGGRGAPITPAPAPGAHPPGFRRRGHARSGLAREPRRTRGPAVPGRGRARPRPRGTGPAQRAGAAWALPQLPGRPSARPPPPPRPPRPRPGQRPGPAAAPRHRPRASSSSASGSAPGHRPSQRWRPWVCPSGRPRGRGGGAGRPGSRKRPPEAGAGSGRAPPRAASASAPAPAPVRPARPQGQSLRAMGNVPSASSDDEELEAGGGGGGATPGAGQGVAGPDGSGLRPAPSAGGLPGAATLLEPGALRQAARLGPGAAPPSEPPDASDRPVLLRWLEERWARGEAVVSLDQLCEALEELGAGEEIYAHFDIEWKSTVDVEKMLETLKSSRGTSLHGELSYVTRKLQACSLVPGFIDIFSESKESLGAHSAMILRFLHQKRVASLALPYPLLDYCHTMCAMRSSVLRESLDHLVQKDKEGPGELNSSQESEELKAIAKCYTYIETSSNSADIDKMTNGETSSYWQSDGSARSHWIRLKMKPDVVLRHLSIAVAASDQSYMPQQVTVAVGRSAGNLQEVRDVHIPSNVTGYVTLLENANISQLYVQINVKRCLSDGCDTRIHGLRAVGFQRVRRGGVSVSDASAIWYWSLLTSLVTASMETSPVFVQTILQNTQKALQHMPPLSLSPASTDGASFLSPSVLGEVDGFLVRITSCLANPEVELTLLAFALARGSIAKVLSSLCAITDHLDTPYQASALISSMATVRQNLLYKYGRILQPSLQACDVKGKEDRSGPENLLAEPWTGDGFLTETGKTRASIIFSTGTEALFQVTQLRIKVRRGDIGAQCGLVFAYNSNSEKFHAEEHFKRFEKYDTWKLRELRHFLKSRVGSSSADLGEDEPAGWFEAEEDWDEVDVKMNQCRVAKYLMIKFLCTRKDAAERLGVQGLSMYGYLRPAGVELGPSAVCATCDPEGDRICGMTLLLKTLSFVQQLAQDLARQKESGLKHKPLLDTAGLSLQLFWGFYSKLEAQPREECVLARCMLLQLLQSCLSELFVPSAQSAAPEELYAHLCQVVDQVGDDSGSLKRLQVEVRNTLLQGAAVFFPDGHARRRHLFAMLKTITEPEQKPSAHLTFRALCTYFSGRDPGGLLLLPEKGGPEGLDMGEVLAVMDMLQAAAARECDMLMQEEAPGESSPALFSLLWSVQGSLLSWCYLQLKGSEPRAKKLAAEMVERYVGQFLASMRVVLRSLLSQYSGKTIVESLCDSVFAMATRQLVIFLLDFCPLDIPHLALLKDLSTLTDLLKGLCSDPSGGPSQMDMDIWQQEKPVVLNTWTMESAHNYNNNCHEVAVFLSPGATTFEVEFDDKCETETRYDYLEFTDSRGLKTRYDTKVGTDKWPKKVTFKVGPQLHFLFHSDSSNNEWGYKFTVTAYGLPDVAVSWGLDLQLLVSRLMGRLASQCLALRADQLGGDVGLPMAKVTPVLHSPLWKPVFRHQLCPERVPGACGPATLPQDGKESRSAQADICRDLLVDFAKSDPAQGFCGQSPELFQGLTQACKKQAPQTDSVASSAVDRAVNAAFAALVYLTPQLYEKLQSYVNSGGQGVLSEEFAQVYALAEGIRIWMLEMKQKFLLDKGDEMAGEVDAAMQEVNPENLARQCAQKSLLLLRFLPVGVSPKVGPWEVSAGPDEVVPLQLQGHRHRGSSVGEEHFQASGPESPWQQPEASLAPSGTPLERSASQQEDIASPPSTPTRKPALGRGRLRLLSFRSVEEARPVPTVTEKYPLLKDVMDFIKDQALSRESVLKVLSLKKALAERVLDALKATLRCLELLGRPHCFQPPCLLFLLELLTCQKDFVNYFGHLEGCGAELHREIRHAYHQVVQFLVEAVKGFSALKDRSLLPALSCVQASLLHLLDMGWEPSDLPFLLEIRLPELLMAMSQENISLHDSVICQWSEEEELASYKQMSEWMEECQDGMFEAWYEKIAQMDSDKQRKMHMFIARYCDLLNVDISCDGCDEIAPWHRYRCLQCHDMDLCKTCFLGGVRPEGHEDDHEMVNMEYACDHCRGVIVGRRMNCNVCDDFDLCYGCYSAKKYSASHLPSHGITVYPMVTIRTSDRQRLIQPYIHNYSWLLFAALMLYSADLASGGEVEGEKPGTEAQQAAVALQGQCLQLIGDCLVKAQRAKDGDTSLESKISVSSSRDGAVEMGGEKAAKEMGRADQGQGDACHETLSSGGGNESQCLGQASLDATDVTGLPGPSSLKTVEEKFVALSPEHVFAECSQKRILGLLAAMLPPLQSGSTISWANLEHILPLMFQVVISNAGHLNETYHLTLGLLGQFIIRLLPAQVDAAVTMALSAKHTLFSAGDGSPVPEGWKTVHLLFSLGAVCLDSRVGLDWACSMADILRALHGCARWHGVVAAFTEHCLKQLPCQLKHTNIFTLLVLVGFPEVLCVGARSVYLDNGNEPHDVIVLKHFTEKSRAVVVDVKTRKRNTVKDCQLARPCGQGSVASSTPLSSHLQYFTSISSQLLRSCLDHSCSEAVEATWVLSLALKGLYRTLKAHSFEGIHTVFLESGLLKLLVKKGSRGTGFSKTWLLRDLEILSVLLYSSKELSSRAPQEPGAGPLQPGSPPGDTGQSKPDPLEGLDEATKVCFLMTHDALNAPLPILRAMYELQMKRTESFFLEVQRRFDGDVITTDEQIRTLAQKWQPRKHLQLEEPASRAVDTDVTVLPSWSKPATCDRVAEESDPVTQKLITSTEGDLQLSYAKQRRAKSAGLLHKELGSQAKGAARAYLHRVNEATAILYARHVLASLLAQWPESVPITADVLELSSPAQMAYILDMLMQLEETQLWEEILHKVLRGCSEDMLGPMALAACHFMEEPGTAVQARESKHPYKNNTTFEDKVHIPGAIYLSVKFDPQCSTEEGCDELTVSSSSDLQQDRHSFSGSSQKWIDFELPGDTLYYRFTSDMSNTEWGYKFTVTAGHLGRFQTGFEILKKLLSEERTRPHLPLANIWAWQVGVACRQTGHQRLKAIHLLLKMVQCSAPSDICDLTLLKPLWQLFAQMEKGLCQDVSQPSVLLPLHRALTELFFLTENRVQELGCSQDYMLALTTDDYLLCCTAQALRNIAAISLAIDYPNKSTSVWEG